MEDKVKFLLMIDDVFDIFGRGVVITGKIQTGKIKCGDMLELVDVDKVTKTKCEMLERYHRVVNEAKQGDYVGVNLSDVTKLEVRKGMKLVIRE